MPAPQTPSPPAERRGSRRRGLSGKERGLIAAILGAGVGSACVLMFFAPGRAVDEQDYRCPPAALATSSEIAASCLDAAGVDRIDERALSQARTAARASFGVLSAAVLAGSAAAIGVVVSNHNAALTRDALNATIKTNTITKDRDEATSTRESDRDRDAAARERERAADERFTTAIGQLGHPSASVRLGGMHSLHRLAQSYSERLPTVVDVLCAYLRQPFHHPDHDWDPGAGHEQNGPTTPAPTRAWWPTSQRERDERDAEREVRRTAARLMPALLPSASEPVDAESTPTLLEVNLAGAVLDGLEIINRRIGDLRLDNAYVAGELRLGEDTHVVGVLELGAGAHITGGLWLEDGAHIDDLLMVGKSAHIDGGIHMDEGAHITGGLWLQRGAHIDGSLWLATGAHIDGGIHMDEGAHITGNLQMDRGARIADGLWLQRGAHIDDGVWLDEGAHIDGSVRLGPAAYISNVFMLDNAASIGGTLTLVKDAHIDGDLTLGEHAHIDGAFHLLEGAYVTGNLVLAPGARIHGPVVIGEGARIDGHLVGTKDGLSEARLHPQAAMRRSWFASAGVPVTELGDLAAGPT